VEVRLQPVQQRARQGHRATIFRELQYEVDEIGSIVDGSVVRAHHDASDGKGGSNEMLWAVLEEVFQPNSTPSSTPRAIRSTSRSRRGNATRRSPRRSSLAHARGKALIGDTGYDSNDFIQAVRARRMTPVIHSKPKRKVKHGLVRRLYRQRNLVETFFHTLKRFRAIGTPYEKTARNFLALVHLACARIWLDN
jgi:transposase